METENDMTPLRIRKSDLERFKLRFKELAEDNGIPEKLIGKLSYADFFHYLLNQTNPVKPKAESPSEGGISPNSVRDASSPSESKEANIPIEGIIKGGLRK